MGKRESHAGVVYLSVIIPVYNTESYLDACLTSVCAQNLEGMEIICVNDGSTDRSGEILTVWANRYRNIRVITKGNGGLSSARNSGLQKARGEYIAFVDSDDRVDPVMFPSMLEKMKQENADVVCCCFNSFPPSVKVPFSFATGEVLDFSGLLQSSNKVFSSNDLCFVCRYVFRKELLDRMGLRFREDLRFAEDGVFITELLAGSRKIILMDEAYYQYRKDNENSLTRSTPFPILMDCLPRVWKAKAEHIRRFSMDAYSPCTQDLALYTLRSFLHTLLKATRRESRHEDVCRILSLEMIRESCRIIGYYNPYENWKEYAFYLAVKWKASRWVSFIFFRHG